MSNIFDYSVDELEEISEKLQMAIEELEDIIDVEEQNKEDTELYIISPSTTALIIAQHQKNIDNIDKLVDFLEEIKGVIDEFITEMEDNVKPNADKVKIDPEEIGDVVKKIEEHIENGNFYNDIVKEGNLFDVWELNVKTDLLHLTEKDKKEQEEFDYCRRKLDDLNDKLHKLYRQIEESTDDLTTKYRLIFEGLEDGKWIKGLVEDLEMEEFDFSEFLSIGLIDSAITKDNISKYDKANLEHMDPYAKFKDGINSIEEYNELLGLYDGGKGPEEVIEIFENHLIKNEEALENLNVIINSLSQTEEWENLTDMQKADWIITLIAGSWYYNGGEGEIVWKRTINNKYYYLPSSVWEDCSIEIVELYHWARDNANEEKHGEQLIDWPHYCATMASYIDEPTFLAGNIEKIFFGGEIYEGSGWLGDYKTDGDNSSPRDITSDYMALKTVQIYQTNEVTPLEALQQAYDSLNQKINDWDEFKVRVIEENIYTEEEFEGLKNG